MRRSFAFASIGSLLLAVGLGSCGGSAASSPGTESPAATEPAGPAAARASDPPVSATDDPAAAESSPSPESAKDEGCHPLRDLQYRHEGDLVVPAEPERRPEGGGRFRHHIDGSLRKGDRRTWIGPPVPSFVPLTRGTAELMLLDRVGQDFVALYRDPYEASSCTITTRNNCDFFVAAFDSCGQTQWSLELNTVMSRPDHLEIGDLRFHEGVLYFNESCQTYSRDAKRKCSALVAFDPVAGTEKWRTRNLVSNFRLMLYRDFIVTIYSFSGEPSHLYVVRISDGKILLKHPIKKGAWNLRIHDDGHLQTVKAGDRHHHYEMIDWDTDKPRLRRVDD